MHTTKEINAIFFGFSLMLATGLTSVQSQVGMIPVTTFTTDDCGGDLFIKTALQDYGGLIYFGSFNGIHKYEGVLTEVNDLCTKGLDLSISDEKITDGYQGNIEVKNKIREFTEFTIFLNTMKS